VIDIHCHILPGMDDGPETQEQALVMCKVAADDGIKTIVATPHTGNGVYLSEAKDVLNGVKRLNELLKEQGISLEILPGHDAYIQPELIENIEKGKVLTINNRKRYVVLELPEQSVPFYVQEVITSLKSKGITGIISHPERNFHIQKNTRYPERLIQSGALLQITASSLTGGFGDSARNTAITLLKRRLVHIIASDAHSENIRPPVLSMAVKEAAKFISEDHVRAMVETNPLEIII